MSPAPAFRPNDVIEFQADQAGQCPRAVVIQRLNPGPPDVGPGGRAVSAVDQALAVAGRDALRRLGWRVVDPDEAAGLGCLVEADGFRIRGDLSGLARQGPILAGVLVKALGDGRFRRVAQEGPEAEPGLMAEAQVTMAGRDLPKDLLVLLRRSEPVFSLALALRGGAYVPDWTYETALDHLIRTGAVEVVEVARDPARLERIMAEHAALEAAIRSGEPPAAEPGPACVACARRRLCAGEVRPDQVGTATLTAAGFPSLDRMLDAYVKARAAADRAASVLKEETETLKRLLVERGARRAVGRAGAIALIKNQGRRSLNPELIPAPIYQAALVRGRPFVTLRFTPAGSQAAESPAPAGPGR